MKKQWLEAISQDNNNNGQQNFEEKDFADQWDYFRSLTLKNTVDFLYQI